MTEDRDARIAEIEAAMKASKTYPTLWIHDAKDFEWLTTELKASLEREKIFRSILKDISEFTADYSNTPTTEANLAREALEKVEKREE